MGRFSQAPIKSRLGGPSGAPGKPTGQCNDTRSVTAGVRPSKCPDTLTVPAISLPAHGLDETGFIQGFAIIGSGILAAAIGVMDQAGREALSLDGHGQGSDGEFGAQVITHRPTNNLPGEVY
jgi:hypothetical protein